jgi:hypothetical protein
LVNTQPRARAASGFRVFAGIGIFACWWPSLFRNRDSGCRCKPLCDRWRVRLLGAPANRTASGFIGNVLLIHDRDGSSLPRAIDLFCSRRESIRQPKGWPPMSDCKSAQDILERNQEYSNTLSFVPLGERPGLLSGHAGGKRIA